MTYIFSIVFLSFITLFSPVFAASFEIDYTKSSISFSGTHAGNAFDGKFENWTANITFDPENLDASSIQANFETSSAKTGNSLYDGTLPQADWFDAKNHPKAEFQSTKITSQPDGTFQIDGTLTLRKISKPVSFKFSLTDFKASPVTAKANFTLNRFDYDIGKKSDPKAEWVSKEIVLTLNIIANKK
ncbi:MAG: YceI family protein [Pseudomonadota bacterium]